MTNASHKPSKPLTKRHKRRLTYTYEANDKSNQQRTISALPSPKNKSLSVTFALAAFGLLGLTGCGDQRQASTSNRPMVITQPKQCADLYWNGQLTDSKGYRWDVFIIPGVGATLVDAGESYKRAGGYIRRFGTRGLFEDGEKNRVGELYEFAGPTCIGDYMIGGIGRDYRNTSHDIADLANDKPFGWFAYVGGLTMWGYVLKPTGRLVTGTVGSAVVATFATCGGALEGTGRTVVASSDVAVMGTIVPVVKLAWHQPAFAVSVFNAEPKLEHDGKWGLHIVGRPPAEEKVANGAVLQ
jgi:hypothetical protein